jgi:hypothetical protein
MLLREIIAVHSENKEPVHSMGKMQLTVKEVVHIVTIGL